MPEPVPAGSEVSAGRWAMIQIRRLNDMRWQSLSASRVIEIGDRDGAK